MSDWPQGMGSNISTHLTSPHLSSCHVNPQHGSWKPRCVSNLDACQTLKRVSPSCVAASRNSVCRDSEPASTGRPDSPSAVATISLAPYGTKGPVPDPGPDVPIVSDTELVLKISLCHSELASEWGCISRVPGDPTHFASSGRRPCGAAVAIYYPASFGARNP